MLASTRSWSWSLPFRQINESPPAAQSGWQTRTPSERSQIKRPPRTAILECHPLIIAAQYIPLETQWRQKVSRDVSRAHRLCFQSGIHPGVSKCRGCRRFRTLRSEEHTSELQSLRHLVCRLLLEKKKTRQ